MSGCATSLDRYSQASGPSRLERMRMAAVRAARDPATWVPAAGALVFSVGDLDERLSDWAYEHTPVFGSPEDANEASDHLRALSCAGAMLTALAIPRPLNGNDGRITTAQGLTGGVAAGLANSAMVGFLKEETDKTRPNGGVRSFPSSHTSQAFACAGSARRNLDAIPMSSSMRTALRWNFTALAAATAWGRIEAYHHYPSDTLAGAALGNFLSNFIYDAFLRPAESSDERAPTTDIFLDLTNDGVWLRFNRGF
ncbi:MAG: phosphatase PAP2 family protein [Acidiferrobacterales bacterium]